MPQGNSLNDIVQADGNTVAVGDDGTIITSKYGAVSSGTSYNLYSVAFGSGTYVAVGESTVLTSPDGNTWTSHDNVPDYGFLSIAYGNNAFVAVGQFGSAYTSLDGGNTWTRQPPMYAVQTQYVQEQTHAKRVSYVNGQFMVLTASRAFYVSPDGQNWTRKEAVEEFQAITYFKGRYVAAYLNGIFSSADLSAWSTDSTLSPSDILNIAADNNTIIAIGKNATIYTSQDAMNWTTYQVPSFATADLTGIALAEGKATVVGKYGLMAQSLDNVTWSSVSSTFTSQDFKSVAYGNNRFIAISSDTLSNSIFSSSDGQTWTNLTLPASGLTLNRIRFVNGSFYLLCNNVVYVSADGNSWSSIISAPNGTTQAYLDLAFANNVYVLAGAGSQSILTSSDRVVWTERWTEPWVSVPGFSGVVYGNNKFVAVGTYGTVGSSSDGLVWSKSGRVDVSYRVRGMAYGNGSYVIADETGGVYSSADGASWLHHYSWGGVNIYDVIHTSDGFVAVGEGRDQNMELNPCLYTSLDGINWNYRMLAATGSFNAIAYGNDSYVLVGNKGLVMQPLGKQSLP